eukprot:13537029-Alexandrium_andersonii.AAC.1
MGRLGNWQLATRNIASSERIERLQAQALPLATRRPLSNDLQASQGARPRPSPGKLSMAGTPRAPKGSRLPQHNPGGNTHLPDTQGEVLEDIAVSLRHALATLAADKLALPEQALPGFFAGRTPPAHPLGTPDMV